MLWRSLVFGALLLPGVVAAKDLCPGRPPIVDPMEMSESDFTAEAYGEALEFLRNGLLEALKTNSSIQALEGDTHFWIQYQNSVRAIEGYVLRERALYEGGSAVTRFCEFLEQSHWSD